jgi:uncharacterized membrane protein
MLFSPFLFIYLLICVALLAGLFILIELEVISYAFLVLGLSPRAAILALFASLIGSYVNIPLYTVPSDAISTATTVNNFGVLYQIPIQYAGSGTTVAINVGGALIPLLICAYALFRWPSALLPSVLGTAIVAYVAHQFAFPVEGVGIALPLFIPPLTAAVVALLIGKAMGARDSVHVIAYVSGVLGTLIGADLTNLNRIAELRTPVASIGGMGTFDGVFLTGIVAVLLAGAGRGRAVEPYENVLTSRE